MTAFFGTILKTSDEPDGSYTGTICDPAVLLTDSNHKPREEMNATIHSLQPTMTILSGQWFEVLSFKVKDLLIKEPTTRKKRTHLSLQQTNFDIC